jgi:hypothetical protein
MRRFLLATIAALAVSGPAAFAQSPSLSPLESRHVPDVTGVLTWVDNAMGTLFDVDFYHYVAQTAAVRSMFTTAGWSAFAPKHASLVDVTRQTRMLCHARAQIPPSLERIEEQPNGFEIVLPIVQTCENVNQVDTQIYRVTAHIVPAATAAHPNGWAIDRMDVTVEQ